MRPRHLLCPLTVLGALCLSTPRPAAQCEVLLTDVTTLGLPIGGDILGRAVAISGDVVFSGAPARSIIEGAHAGFVVVQRWNGSQWVLDQYLKSPAPVTDGWFGMALDASGDRLVAGALGPAPHGNVFTFQRSGNQWLFEQDLVLSSPPPWSLGEVVSIDGDRIAVGLRAPNQVVMFHREGGVWVEAQVLQGPAESTFGYALDLHGDQLAVGADSALGSFGGAFVFRHDGSAWVPEGGMLTASDGEYLDRFGSAVAIEGDTLFVGAPAVSGAVYRFERSGGLWTEQQILSEGCCGKERYGRSLALDDGLLAVGTYGGEDGPSLYGSGTVYLYRPGGSGDWERDRYTKASDPQFHGAYGEVIALEGERLVAGQSNKDVGHLTNVGGTYVHTVTGAVDAGHGLAGFAGQSPRLDLEGALCGDDAATLDLTQARPGSAAALVVGLDDVHLAFKGGTLVPFPDVLITGLTTDAGGALTLSLSWPAGYPGLTTHWQVIVADVDGPVGFALSNALAVTGGGL